MGAVADDTVLVAGGGIAGLALARALRQRDVPVELAERTPGGAGGLAINLPGNAVTALGTLGVGDGLARIGRPTGRREYRARNGRLLFEVDEDAFWGAGARPRCVLRSELHALLADGLDVVPRAATVESVRTVTGGTEVTFGDGDVRRYGFVAGADGVRSAVRSSVFGSSGVREAVLSSASWRFMAPNPGVDCWVAWSGAGGSFMLIPVGDERVYGYASATRGGPAGADPSWLAGTFATFPEPVRAVVGHLRDRPESLYHSPIEEVRVPSWASGRVVLIGDAAHATAPVWAQGGALAAEDALVLAELLAEGEWDTVGARYERRRRARVEQVGAATDRFSKALSVPTWLRDRLAPVIGPRSYRDAYDPLRRPMS